MLYWELGGESFPHLKIGQSRKRRGVKAAETWHYLQSAAQELTHRTNAFFPLLLRAQNVDRQRSVFSLFFFFAGNKRFCDLLSS